LTPVVINLRPEVWPAQETAERMASVCRRLTDHLTANQHLRNSADFRAYRESPNEAYPNLGDYLADDIVVIALLPQSELVAELEQYAKLSRARLVFLAELSDSHHEDNLRKAVQVPAFRAPILLNVGLLDDGHGEVFVRDRFRRSADTASLPRLEPSTLERMTTPRRISIHELQTLLFEVYEEVLALQPPPSEVTWEYISDFYWRTADRGPHSS
jgi:hypothetical protein